MVTQKKNKAGANEVMDTNQTKISILTQFWHPELRNTFNHVRPHSSPLTHQPTSQCETTHLWKHLQKDLRDVPKLVRVKRSAEFTAIVPGNCTKNTELIQVMWTTAKALQKSAKTPTWEDFGWKFKPVGEADNSRILKKKLSFERALDKFLFCSDRK